MSVAGYSIDTWARAFPRPHETGAAESSGAGSAIVFGVLVAGAIVGGLMWQQEQKARRHDQLLREHLSR